jgi:hypothetical protein
MAVDRTEELLCRSGKIAFGPTSLWIWCAWKWTRVSWSRDDILADEDSMQTELQELSRVSFCFKSGESDSSMKPQANFRTRGFPNLPSLTAWTNEAFSLHSTRDCSSNIQYLAWVEQSKSIVLFASEPLLPWNKEDTIDWERRSVLENEARRIFSTKTSRCVLK